ncbi:DUF6415 family natural product biosynthesis protein [Streptomyces sp. STR69]|uniref:DUF6415 family natural product biosynthesis protein n=1 Tax=Streptomyces sp. STR69 TaxID=1796942 RepID=UPI0021C5B7B9|nr:DUF6415 family natural product biosynthesis protein [Streptomyces sp. STR69]
MSNTLLPVDADTIQHTYESVLLSIRLPTGDALGTLNETLQGHVQLLAPEVRNLSPRMRGETRRTAVHILVRTSHLLKETTGSPTAQLPDTYDLAVTARGLLTLYLHPGPLGSPTAEDEIAEQIGQRLCGACWEPIEDDEPYERRPFDSDSAGAIHGYVHAEPCVDRPSLLVPVRPEDSST